MRAHQKSTAVPGAYLLRGAEGPPILDKKGRFMWGMPKPTSVVLHTKRSFRGKGKTKVVQVEKVEVPVYRGVDARLARHIKSQIRRNRRKEAERKATEALKVEVPDNLMEELTDD